MRTIKELLIASLILLFALGTAVPAAPASAKQLDDLKGAYVLAVKKANEDHARKPGKTLEQELAKKFPVPARRALETLLKMKDSPELFDRLLACAEAALDLDLMADFEKARTRLEKSSPDHAARLGIALSRPRFILRGLGGLDVAYLEAFAEALEAILECYDETFGFKEWSKVPGKKLRVRIHLEKEIERPPHFAPEFPFHSEVDFPVIDPRTFRSPTQKGHFLFYGLCHELGHVIAMWGSPRNEEDHHSWAHYTGVVIVERLSESAKGRPFLQSLLDVRWRSLSAEKKRLGDHAPSLSDADGVLALLIALHEKVGPKAIGDALNALDQKDRRLRVNRVRYYTFKELREALLETLKPAGAKKAVEGLFSQTTRK